MVQENGGKALLRMAAAGLRLAQGLATSGSCSGWPQQAFALRRVGYFWLM
ncbi:MAG: hypothetical protein LBG47_05220 [Prevotellaceae bacterium]|nr:hypothetical protein [Prevotellaceae bacterium]